MTMYSKYVSLKPCKEIPNWKKPKRRKKSTTFLCDF